jgi:hypothetical protein
LYMNKNTRFRSIMIKIKLIRICKHIDRHQGYEIDQNTIADVWQVKILVVKKLILIDLQSKWTPWPKIAMNP